MVEVWEWIRAQHIVFIPTTENTDTVSVNGTSGGQDYVQSETK